MNEKLETNTTMSHYPVVSKIGASDRGKVYRARDHQPGRQIAKLSVGQIARTDNSCIQRCPKPAVESRSFEGRINR
jgi:hypothetical protein